MYESSCSYQSALDLKRSASPSSSIIKTEDFGFGQSSEWSSSYRFHQSTFEQLKQSVEKAKAALQDRSFLGTSSAFRYRKEAFYFINYSCLKTFFFTFSSSSSYSSSLSSLIFLWFTTQIVTCTPPSDLTITMKIFLHLR